MAAEPKIINNIAFISFRPTIAVQPEPGFPAIGWDGWFDKSFLQSCHASMSMSVTVFYDAKQVKYSYDEKRDTTQGESKLVSPFCSSEFPESKVPIYSLTGYRLLQN